MASLRETAGQIRNFWTQLPTGRKISFVLIFLVVAAAFTVLILWTSRPDYKILYADLPVEDANSITTKLKDLKVPYELSRGGTTIAVPSKDFYEVKMSLANAGLPTGPK